MNILLASSEVHPFSKTGGLADMVGALANGFSQVGNETTIAYLDEKQYWPFWAMVEKLDVPFYLHPRNPLPQHAKIYEGHGWLMGPSWAFGQETAVHALRLMGSGLFDKHPNINIVIGHMGEGLPFSMWRVDNANAWIPNRNHYPAKKKIVEYFQNNFHITVSGNFHTQALLNAMMVIGSDRIMFSTDWPFENIDHAALWFDATAGPGTLEVSWSAPAASWTPLGEPVIGHEIELVPAPPGGAVVMVVDDKGVAHQKKVDVGVREPELVQILAGVSPGEKVITVGGLGLEAVPLDLDGLGAVLVVEPRRGERERRHRAIVHARDGRGQDHEDAITHIAHHVAGAVTGHHADDGLRRRGSRDRPRRRSSVMASSRGAWWLYRPASIGCDVVGRG